jgi:hypothetical protein
MPTLSEQRAFSNLRRDFDVHVVENQPPERHVARDDGLARQSDLRREVETAGEHLLLLIPRRTNSRPSRISTRQVEHLASPPHAWACGMPARNDVARMLSPGTVSPVRPSRAY